jgi:hypothetical protein
MQVVVQILSLGLAFGLLAVLAVRPNSDKSRGERQG